VEAEEGIVTKAAPGFSPVVLRFSTAFGLSPRMRFDLLLNEFVRDATKGLKLRVYGQSSWRPYIHTCDIARAVIQCIEAEASVVSGETYNVGGDSHNCTKKELLAQILQALPGTEYEGAEDVDDPRSYRVSFEKIKMKVGFQPRHSIIAGIDEIAAAIGDGIFADPFDAVYRNST
jgi:nucleoside-diphosphate-sugar epimerase